MFTFKETNKYNSTIAQFCEEINVGRNLFYKWLINKKIFDSEKDPTLEYQKYFIGYSTPYRDERSGTSYYITDDGKQYIKSILTSDDLLKMPRSKKASPRHQSNYKHYGNYYRYPAITITEG